jgi:cytochrome P450
MLKATDLAAHEWADDYDIFSDEYRARPHSRWAAMREECPMARSDRWGGSWMPVLYDDILAIARDPERFSSRAVEVAGPTPENGGGLFAPPLTSDPPEHKQQRGLLIPFFSPRRIVELEPSVRETARSLVERLAERGEGDASMDFAEPLTTEVLARLLDVPRETRGRFYDWTYRLVRTGPRDQAVRTKVIGEILAFLDTLLTERTASPGEDLISFLAHAEMDGKPLSRKHKLGSSLLVLIAGADTTWSAIGASLWHLGTHPQDRARLAAEPALIETAVEELLRAYAPVTMARIATEPVELHGRCIAQGDRVLVPFGAANRDPSMFDDPDHVKLDRQRNRHLTFGSGVHRCLGSNLARMELRVALEEWLRVIPEFHVLDPDEVAWTGGQVNGPEHVPFAVGP